MSAARDPRLGTRSWQAIVTYWQELQPEQCEAPVCLLPGVAIRYRRTRGPASLDVGHIVPLVEDTRQSWTVQDTRPEHARCNRSAGVAIGKARAAARGTTRRRAQPARRPRATAMPDPMAEQASTAARW